MTESGSPRLLVLLAGRRVATKRQGKTITMFYLETINYNLPNLSRSLTLLMSVAR